MAKYLGDNLNDEAATALANFGISASVGDVTQDFLSADDFPIFSPEKSSPKRKCVFRLFGHGWLPSLALRYGRLGKEGNMKM
ncbi:MAG TPA: hypothetical protein VGM58_05925 [Verrucomicrobiae bacterium]